MYVQCGRRDEILSWSAEKARRNLAKHGISFETAQKVFSDPHAIIVEDCDDERGEMRYHAVGYANTHLLLMVVFVVRSSAGQEITHIISARKAVAYEVSAYTDQF